MKIVLAIGSLCVCALPAAFGQRPNQDGGNEQHVNAQTGTSYTYNTSDFAKLVTHSNAAAIAATLPQCPSGGYQFHNGFHFDVMNLGAGTLTITPATGTIDGAATLVLTTGSGAHVVCDGTTWSSWHGGTSCVCADIVPWSAVPSLLNSWTNVGGAQPAQYRVDCTNQIQTRGKIAPGTTTDGTVLFTLPIGSRPALPVSSVVRADNTSRVAQLQFNANGDVAFYAASAPATFVDLNGGSAPQGTASSGFAFCRSITPNAAQITGTIANFAVPIIGTFDGTAGTLDLRTVAHGSPIQSASGFDIVVLTDSGCTTLAPFERVTWNATTGVSEFWALHTSINSSSNTPLYIGGGNPAVITDQSNAAGIWTPGGNVLVTHFGDGSTPNVSDSTGLKTGTNHSTTAGAGKVGPGAGVFDGTNGWIDYGTTTALPFNGNTVMAWVNTTSGLGTQLVIDDYTGSGGASLQLNDVGTLSVEYDYFQDNSNYKLVDTNTMSLTIPTNAWTHIAATFDGTTIKLFVNGAAAAMTSQANVGTVTSSYTPGVLGMGGRNGSSSNRFPGKLDEGRIVTSVLAAGTIATIYNAQSNPAAFITIGP